MPENSLGAILLGFALVGMQVASAAKAMSNGLHQPKISVIPRRLPQKLARAALNWQLLLGVVLYVSYDWASWSAESVGFRSTISPVVAPLVGAAGLGLVESGGPWRRRIGSASGEHESAADVGRGHPHEDPS